MAPSRSSSVVPFTPFSAPPSCSLSSPRQSSHPYRVLEVETESRASAKLWVYHDDKIVAKVDRTRGVNTAWNKKFLFAVTEDFLFDDDSLLFLDIYSRPTLPLLGGKKLMGTAKCSVKDALKGIDTEGDGELVRCTLPLNGVSGMADGTLKVKLRLWREVLEYVGEIDHHNHVSSDSVAESGNSREPSTRRKKHYGGFSCFSA